MILRKPLLVSFSLLAFAGAACANQGAQSSGTEQAQAGTMQKQALGGVSAKALIGATVSGAQGEALGEIEDLVVNVGAGRVYAALLDAGDGTERYAFPIEKLGPGRASGGYTLALEKDQLEGAAAAGGTQAAADMELTRVSEMLGVNIQDRSGNDVGEVKDVLVRLDSDEVSSIVIDLNEGGEAAVEPGAIDAGTGEDIVLDMSAEELERRAQSS